MLTKPVNDYDPAWHAWNAAHRGEYRSVGSMAVDGDGGTAGAGGSGAAAEPEASVGSSAVVAEDETPAIEIEEDAAAGDAEPDDLEEVEFDGRKAKIPKAWKDPLEQGKDYRFKTGELAKERKTIETARTQYTGLIQRAEAALKANEPQRPDDSMLDPKSAKYDPDGYHLAVSRYNKWAAELFRTTQERKRLAKEDADKAANELTERKAKSQAAAIKAVPKWKDPAVRAADKARIEAYAQATLGVADDELGDLEVDHRLNVAVYKAMLYDEAVAKHRAGKGATEEPVTVPQKHVRGGSGSAAKSPSNMTMSEWMKWRDAQEERARARG